MRLRFRPDINFEAQQVLARLFAHLAQSMDGVTDCSVRFEQSGGDWVAQIGGPGTPLRVGEQQTRSVVHLCDARQRKGRS